MGYGKDASMKIGVLSDTHDNLANVIMALEGLRERGIDTIIHCGDLTDFELLSYFREFRLIYLLGNMDHVYGTIVKKVQQMNPDNFAGPVFTGSLGDVPVAATHSHLEGKLTELVQSRRYQWIFYGHTHQRKDEMVNGTRVVNPGALGGLRRGLRTYCIADLTEQNVEFITVSHD
jgi:hypothetical protein